VESPAAGGILPACGLFLSGLTPWNLSAAMFVDRAKIYVIAGDGGNGCLAFRREKFVPRGGPSGGDGGNGGNVWIQASRHLNTLVQYRYQRHLRAEKGSHGQGSNKHGKNGEDLIFEVPVGTLAIDLKSGETLVDLVEPDKPFLLAHGGKGGRGNAAFVSSVNQAPQRAEPGAPGEQLEVLLELKVLADVGLVGYPNAGKSTLISVLSAARPKIADYPFTTLTPHLGVVECPEFKSFVVADIPGLIEGAHEGSGLGDQFLRHVERCRLLVHLIDVSGLGDDDPVAAYQTVNRELELYNPDLGVKPQMVVASKMDAADPEKLRNLELFCERQSLELLKISSATGEGIGPLKLKLLAAVEAIKD